MRVPVIFVDASEGGSCLVWETSAEAESMVFADSRRRRGSPAWLLFQLEEPFFWSRRQLSQEADGRLSRCQTWRDAQTSRWKEKMLSLSRNSVKLACVPSGWEASQVLYVGPRVWECAFRK